MVWYVGLSGIIIWLYIFLVVIYLIYFCKNSHLSWSNTKYSKLLEVVCCQLISLSRNMWKTIYKTAKLFLLNILMNCSTKNVIQVWCLEILSLFWLHNMSTQVVEKQGHAHVSLDPKTNPILGFPRKTQCTCFLWKPSSNCIWIQIKLRKCTFHQILVTFWVCWRDVKSTVCTQGVGPLVSITFYWGRGES